MTDLPRQTLRLAIVLLAALVGGAGHAAAACAPREAGVDVYVGVRQAPPFIMADPIRGQRGLTFDLWTGIERELRRDGLIGRTAYVECPLGDQLEALASGDIDLVISPLTITAERLERFEFTHQYLSSGLTVAQRSSSAIDFGYATGILRDTLGNRGVMPAILVFLAANLVLAALIGRGLRQGTAFGVEPGEPGVVRLLRCALETMVRTIGLKGMSDGSRTTAARAVEVFMAVVGTVLSATIFGVLTTALVGSIGGARDVSLTDLPGRTVATLADSTAQAFLEQLLAAEAAVSDGAAVDEARGAPAGGPLGAVVPAARAASTGPDAGSPCRAAGTETGMGPEAAPRCVTTTSWQAAMTLLARGEVELVLGDWAQLAYLSRLPDFADQVGVQSSTFRLEPYGWGVSAQRPELRAAIDRALVARVRSTDWRFMVQEYMGSGSISPD